MKQITPTVYFVRFWNATRCEFNTLEYPNLEDALKRLTSIAGSPIALDPKLFRAQQLVTYADTSGQVKVWE